MGKQSKKEKANSQKPSSSKSSRKRTMDKTNNVNSQKEKKLKKETKTIVQESSINDLPPEMLLKVLNQVDTKSLIGCRLLNRRWNEIATEILQSRPDLILHFYCCHDLGTAQFLLEDDERNLLDFLQCFEKSKYFPFAHFCFRQVDCSSFAQRDWIKFISDLGKNIKGVKLSIKSTVSKEKDLIELTKNLRNVLLNKLPELEKFGFQYESGEIPNSSKIELFPTSTTSGKSSKSKPKPKPKPTVQLPYLKVLYLDEFMLSKYFGIANELLCASPNLQKLESFDKDEKYNKLEIFQLLQSLGKLSCLQAAKIDPVEILLNLKENPSAPPLEFKLKSLDLNLWTLYTKISLWSDASIFLSKFFESCKDTLEELGLDSLGFLDDLQLPKFTGLNSISTYKEYFKIKNTFQDPPSESFFPSQVNPGEIFPALRSLNLVEMSWSTAFPVEDGIPYFPTLETLKITGEGMNEDFIAEISLMCPNLKDFHILWGEELLENFVEVGRAIWTHLTTLESLRISADADNPEGIFPGFDSCITGFSKKDCKRLYDLLVADKLLKKCGSRVKVPQSELEAERKFPSILDLKDLKFFQLEVFCCYTDVDSGIQPNLAKMGPTAVSERCALDLMENLVYDIDKVVGD